MAYRLIKNSNHYSSCMGKQYQCDFLNDIGKLPTSKRIGEKQENDTVSDDPCGPGSECFCFEDGSIWILGIETDTWIRVGYKYGGSSGSAGGSGSGITSYNQLNDVPLKNLTGRTSTPLVLSDLESGIYKIAGNYSITSNSKSIPTGKSGNIFIIYDEKILDMAAEGVTLFEVQPDGGYTSDTYTTADAVSTEITKQLNSDVFNSQIEDKITENLSYATNDDIDNLF